MNRSAIAVLTAIVVLGLAIGGMLVVRPPPAHDGPNVLLIVWDTTRADRLSLYGYHKPTTPRLDAFAKEAVVFDRAVSPAMWTPPSHSSMFTGYAPTHHGVEATNKWLDSHHVTLAEQLALNGYDTYAFSANPYVAPSTNITQGFSQIDNTFTGEWKKAARRATKAKLIDNDASSDISPKWKPQQGQNASGTAHAFKDAAPVAHEALMEWLGGRSAGRPWFAFVNMMETHIPRVPSMASRKKIMSDAEIQLGLRTDVAQINLLAHTFGQKTYDPDEIAAINGIYDAAVIDLDTATGDLLDDLRSKGMLDNTIVILTADHGENLGDHGMFGHKYNVYDTLLHVPLLIWYPEKLAPKRIKQTVSNLNLFTTILNLVGVAVPDTQPESHGSLLDDAIGPAFSELNETTPISIIRMAKTYGVDDASRYVRTFKAVEVDGWKLIRAADDNGSLLPGQHELYDLHADPLETTNRIAEQGERAARMQGLIDDWVSSVGVYDPALRSEKDRHVKIDGADKEMLQQLGYIGDDEGGARDEDADPELDPYEP